MSTTRSRTTNMCGRGAILVTCGAADAGGTASTCGVRCATLSRCVPLQASCLGRVPVDLGEAREPVRAIHVHGARAADALTARPTEGQLRVLLVLDGEEHVQHHRPALVDVHRVFVVPGAPARVRVPPAVEVRGRARIRLQSPPLSPRSLPRLWDADSPVHMKLLQQLRLGPRDGLLDRLRERSCLG